MVPYTTNPKPEPKTLKSLLGRVAFWLIYGSMEGASALLPFVELIRLIATSQGARARAQ